MPELNRFREWGLDNTLADTFPCSDPLSSIPDPDYSDYQERTMAIVQRNTSDRRYLQRECPICGYTQLVAVSDFHESLVCEKCDYLIPAKRKAA